MTLSMYNLDDETLIADLDDYPHVVVRYQSGLHLTLIATHTGVGLVDQDNEVAEVDVIQQVEDEVDVFDNPEEVLIIDLVEDGFLTVNVARGNVDAKNVPVECFRPSDVELALVRVEVKEVQVEDEDVDESVKQSLSVLAIVDVDEGV